MNCNKSCFEKNICSSLPEPNRSWEGARSEGQANSLWLVCGLGRQCQGVQAGSGSEERSVCVWGEGGGTKVRESSLTWDQGSFQMSEYGSSLIRDGGLTRISLWGGAEPYHRDNTIGLKEVHDPVQADFLSPVPGVAMR